MQSSADRVIYAFGPYRLDPAGRRLLRDGETLAVTAKVLDVLIALVEARGEVLDRDALMDRVWPATAVVDANLTQTVSVLRKHLGDTASEHRYVATVPGRGYQFTAPVEVIRRPAEGTSRGAARRQVLGDDRPVGDDRISGDPTLDDRSREPHSRGRRLGPRRLVLLGSVALALAVVALAVIGDRFGPAGSDVQPGRAGARTSRSLAVLPFVVLTPQRLDPAFGSGLSAALTTRMDGQSSVAVRPTQAVLDAWSRAASPAAVAAAVDADLVVTGTVQEADGTVRVTSQLIDVSRGHALRSVSFDQPMTSLLGVEAEIAERLARELTLSLVGVESPAAVADGRGAGTGGGTTASAEAYREVLLGRALLLERTREGYEEAISHFEQALARDPDYTLALGDLALSHALLASNGNCKGVPRDHLARAGVEARRALSQAPDLPAAHIGLGLVLMNGDYDWAAASEELRRATEIDPESILARYYLSISLILAGDEAGAWREAQVFGHPSSDAAPMVELNRRFLYGIVASLIGRLDDARQALERALAIAPDRGGVRMHYALVLDALGHHEEALSELDRASLQFWSSSQVTATLANYLGRSGDPADRARARRILADLEVKEEESPGRTLSLAIAHAGAGSPAEAIRLLWAAHERREVLPIVVQRDPRLDPLRGEPELARLLRAMHLAPAAGRGPA